ncbi:hypothetical protein [Methanobrevibacter sp.]
MVILYSMEYTAREVRILTFYKVEVVQQHVLWIRYSIRIKQYC